MGRHIHIYLPNRITARAQTHDFIRGEIDSQQPVGTLYAGHPLSSVSTAAMKAWALGQGFEMKREPHITTAASRTRIDRRRIPAMSAGLVVPPGGRKIEQFGDHLVLCLDCDELQKRHATYRAAGASWDFPAYQPHVTLGRAINLPPLAEIEPFDEPITLGAEVLAPFDDY